MNSIITIAREVGSGGRVLGRYLADALGYTCYDREILAEIAQHASLTESYVQGVVEQRPQFAVPFTAGPITPFVADYAAMPSQSVYQAQREAILAIAKRSQCVIVGRCADYILRDLKPLRVFLHADLDCRVRRCLERQAPGKNALDEKAMRQWVQRCDRDRAKYYDFYTGLRWGAKENYDLCLNTTNADLQCLANALATAIGRISVSDPDRKQMRPSDQ